MIDWKMTITIITGTSPLLFVILWSLIDFRDFKKEVREEFRLIRIELRELRAEITNIHKEISSIKERISTLEERDRVRLH